MNLRHKLKITGYTLLATIVILYSLYSARNLIRGPILNVYEPADNTVFSTSTIHIKGTAPNAKLITLNDQAIVTDEAGNFDEIRLLYTGQNVYKLFITDKFNRKNQKILHLYLQDSL